MVLTTKYRRKDASAKNGGRPRLHQGKAPLRSETRQYQSSDCHSKARFSLQRGFQLLEVLIVVAIIGVLGAIAFPLYLENEEQQQVLQAQIEIQDISSIIEQYILTNGRFPDTLAEAGVDHYRDPWGRPYTYLRILGGNTNKGNQRRDRSLNPVNTDFDLYSLGADGESKPQFTFSTSLDDVVRANNGLFFGLVAEY